MINTNEQRDFFKEIFREVILEVMNEERLSFYDSIFPNASKEEITEIEKLYGTPENYKKEDFVNVTDWVLNGD